MAQSKSKGCQRKVSDDVTSLDSWSELTSDNTGKSPDDRKTKEKELVLNVNKLSTIPEPPVPKLRRVKLNKSGVNRLSDGQKSDQSVFCYLPGSPGVNDPSPVPPVVKGAQFFDSKTFDGHNLESDMYLRDDLPTTSQSGPSSLLENHHTDICNCNYCLEKTSGHKSLPLLHSHNESDSMFGSLNSRNYLKKHSSTPYLQNIISKMKNKDNSDEEPESDQNEKVKDKILSVWNNVRYGWTLKSKTNFEKDSPLFLLGCCYHKRPDDEEPAPGERLESLPSMEMFKQDFQSRLWFTYRKGFPALPQTKFTTDCGWGCMLRSSQMMLGQAFICHFLGRKWRLHNQTKEQSTFYRQIVQWFGDTLSDQCPFSVHKLSEIGKLFGKQPGEWYGPSSVAYILRDAVFRAATSQPVLKDLCIYVAQDCTVYKQDIHDLCSQRPRNLTTSDSDDGEITQANKSSNSLTDISKQEWTRSVIILIPVRLGGEEFNTIYSSCIKNLMAEECCLGLIGGKPKHSLYFVGWQEDKLIYLDPHFCQDNVDILKRDFKIESFHCYSPRKVSLSKMDPSATVGFYCRTKEDFEKFVAHTEQMVLPSRGTGVYPMFVFNEGKGSDMIMQDLSISMERSIKIRHVIMDEDGRIRSSTVDSEEFVVL
ncbi:Cysteine protease atg4c [Mactra antiquata]